MNKYLIATAVAACVLGVAAQDVMDLPALLDGLLEGADIDLSEIEAWGEKLEEASKNCDTDKLNQLADACGSSMVASMKTCTEECKTMFAFMGENDGCGELYEQFGMGNIESICNGGDIEDVFSPMPIKIDEQAADSNSPDAAAASTESTNAAPGVPAKTSGSNMVSITGAVLALYALAM